MRRRFLTWSLAMYLIPIAVGFLYYHAYKDESNAFIIAILATFATLAIVYVLRGSSRSTRLYLLPDTCLIALGLSAIFAAGAAFMQYAHDPSAALVLLVLGIASFGTSAGFAVPRVSRSSG